MINLRSAEGVDVKGKRVILRVAFDVKYNKAADGQLTVRDDSRIKAAVPTITDLAEWGAKVVLMTWLQRPEGKVVPEMSLAPVAKHLEKLLGRPVHMLPDCIGEETRHQIDAAPNGAVLMLENVRFHPGEKGTKELDMEYAKELAKNGDIFINDAFPQVHRKVASIYGIATLLPSYAGPQLIKEVRELNALLANTEKPFTAVIGGAKISSKIGLIKTLLGKVDHLLLGGALANTILRAKGLQIGTSLVEESMVEEIKAMNLTDTRLHIPVDVVTAKEIREGAPTAIRAAGSVQEDEKILDIGPDTVKLFNAVIGKSRTIVWNGPMGYFELPEFSQGTYELAMAVAASNARCVVGGGETVAAINRTGVSDKISFVSLGGGAMLKFLEKEGNLPGLEPLRTHE